MRGRGGVFEIIEFGSLRAREIKEIEARFNNDLPSWGHQIYVTDKDAIDVKTHYVTPFGTKMTFFNNTDKIQVLTGGEGSGLFMSAKTLFPAEPGTIKKSVGEEIVKKKGIEEVQLDSKWIQTPAAAHRMADWFMANFYSISRTISLNMLGNPSIEVGDIIELRGVSNSIIDNSYLFGSIPGKGKYLVTSVNHNMSTDFTTQVSAYLIGKTKNYSIIDNSVLRESTYNSLIVKDNISA